MTLIGRLQDYEHGKYLEQLKTLIGGLNLNDEVQFRFDLTRTDLQAQLKQASIGLHTKHQDCFSIRKRERDTSLTELIDFRSLALVEMMAAGLIVLAHRSGAPRTDIIEDGQTGYLAGDIDSYATAMNDILTMSAEQRRQMQERARESLARFSPTSFEQSFMQQFDQMLYLQ